MGNPDTDWYAVELEAGEIYRIRVNGSTPQDPEVRMNDSASNATAGATDNDGGTVRVPETRLWSLTCRDWGSMLSPRVPNLVPIPGLRMERETPGQRPRPNYGHPQARLDKLFDAHPRLRAGWQALQELHGLYLADDYDGALDALGRFCDLYETGELPEFHDTVDTFIAWSDEILAWHHSGRASNGRIEGIILWSVSEGVVDVADGHVAGCRGRVLWSVSLASAMLLAV